MASAKVVSDPARALVELPRRQQTRLVAPQATPHGIVDLLRAARDAPDPDVVDPPAKARRRVLPPTDPQLVHARIVVADLLGHSPGLYDAR